MATEDKPSRYRFRVRAAGGLEMISAEFDGPAPLGGNELSLLLEDEDGVPLKGFHFRVTGAGPSPITGMVGDDGHLQAKLPGSPRSVTVDYWPPDAPDEVDSMEVALGDAAGGPADPASAPEDPADG